MERVSYKGATLALRRAVLEAELSLVQHYSKGACVWIGDIDPVLRDALHPKVRIVRGPSEVTCESTRYDTLVLSPAFGRQIGPEALRLLCELVMQPDGVVLLPGMSDVGEFLSRLGSSEIAPLSIGPYGLLSDNRVNEAVFGDFYQHASNQLGRVLDKPEARSFWVWLESQLYPILPPWLCSRNFVVLSRDGNLETCIRKWEAFDHCPTIDMSALQYLLGESSGDFFRGLNEKMESLECYDLVAKLSDLFECRLQRKVDFLPLLTTRQRGEVMTRIAWYWAEGAHEVLSRDDFYLDDVFLPQQIDFMLFNPFVEIMAGISEQYP